MAVAGGLWLVACGLWLVSNQQSDNPPVTKKGPAACREAVKFPPACFLPHRVPIFVCAVGVRRWRPPFASAVWRPSLVSAVWRPSRASDVCARLMRCCILWCQNDDFWMTPGCFQEPQRSVWCIKKTCCGTSDNVSGTLGGDILDVSSDTSRH